MLYFLPFNVLDTNGARLSIAKYNTVKYMNATIFARNKEPGFYISYHHYHYLINWTFPQPQGYKEPVYPDEPAKYQYTYGVQVISQV